MLVQPSLDSLDNMFLDGVDLVDFQVGERGVVAYSSTRRDLFGVSDEGLSVEGCEEVHLVHMGSDLVAVYSDLEVAVGSLDARVVFSKAKSPESRLDAGTGEDVCRRIDAAPLRTTCHPGEVIDTGFRFARLGQPPVALPVPMAQSQPVVSPQ